VNPSTGVVARLVALAVGSTLVLGIAGCGSSSKTTSSTTSGSTTASAPSRSAVSIKDFKYSPDSVTVKAGVAVQITNNDSQPHTLTSDTAGVFDAGSIPPGGSPAAPVVVMSPGTYTYHCSFHPFMHGTLIVQ
jgi:plastocyanin